MNFGGFHSAFSAAHGAIAGSLRQLIPALIATATVFAADASPLWKIAPEPEWVKPVEVTIPTDIPTRDLQNGIFHLLLDYPELRSIKSIVLCGRLWLKGVATPKATSTHAQNNAFKVSRNFRFQPSSIP